MVDRFLRVNVSKLNGEFRNQMSNEHKMYLSGPEDYMQSTAPIQCMSDSDGSNLVFLGPSGDLMLIVGVHQMFLVLPCSGNLMRIILI